MRDRLLRAVPVVIGLVLFVLALGVLRSELRAVTWHALTADLHAMPLLQLSAALLLTAANYIVLTGYDVLAFAYIGKHVAWRRVAATSFLAYAVSNNVGFAMLSGASVRYRFYTRWGVSPTELSHIVFSYSVTFWLGLLALGGLSLVVAPIPAVAWLPAHGLLMPVGWALMMTTPAYVGATLVRHAPLRVWRVALPMPRPGIAAGQALVSALDWTLAAAVLYVLLPAGAPGPLTFAGMFLSAALLGMLSHVPGGLGVFEGLMLVFLRPYLAPGALLPSLVVFRVVYYLVPLSIALVALTGDEVWRRRASLARAGSLLGRAVDAVTPRAVAVMAFMAGVVLLVSGATPAADGRLALLDRVLPLGVIEMSHFVGSIAGALLLILSQGLARRLDGARYATMGTLIVGIAASLLKGFDYEEATVLLGILVMLWRARAAFYRRAAFFETRFSVEWMAAIAATVASSIWLGLFAFRHVDYAHELWWQFELQGDASRFMRASVGACIVVVLVAVARLLRVAPHEAPTPTGEDLAAAERIIGAQSSTAPSLVFLRDKAVMFDDERRGFVMYAVQGRTWVALGDPVCPPELMGTMVRLFLERCTDFAGVPVFYQVRKQHLHAYADAGFTFVKLGEEASVDLASFTLEGGAGSKNRQALRRLERAGGVFRIVTADEVSALLPRLREVSDEWLDAKSTAEKGFSLGFFDEDYLSRFPVAVIERAGRIDAFCNVWPGRDRREVSIDLMRHRRDAPNGVMDALLVALMQWARAHGYASFALGMAPLAGVDASPIAPLWNRVGSTLYQHGESIYGFQGLRAYKQKFTPVWEPRYLAYPGGLRLPRIMADVSALIAGGYRQIFAK